MRPPKAAGSGASRPATKESISHVACRLDCTPYTAPAGVGMREAKCRAVSDAAQTAYDLNGTPYTAPGEYACHMAYQPHAV